MLGDSAVDLAKIAPEVRFKLPELPQPEPIGPELERRNLYSAVARFFNALAEQRPLIITDHYPGRLTMGGRSHHAIAQFLIGAERRLTLC